VDGPSNNHCDHPDEGPDNGTSDPGRHPHLEHGEPSRRWIRTQAEDQPNQSAEEANDD